MKTEITKNSFWNIKRINFILLILFFILNNLDYFSTYLSIIGGGIEINPIIIFMIDFPILFFVLKIFILPWFIWWFVYESDSKKVMWNMIFVDLVYLVVVCGNLRVVF